MKLRQIAVAAEDLQTNRKVLMSLVGAQADFEDPGVGEFGLTNSVVALGNSFFEIVSPIAPDTAAGRMLQRQGGDCGYMLLFQTPDLEPVSQRVVHMGLRKIWETERDEVSAFHLHPKDIGGAIVSIDEMRPPESWLWGGPHWAQQRADRVGDIMSATLAVEDPRGISHQWAAVLGVPCEGPHQFPHPSRREGYALSLDEGQRVLFIQANEAPVPGLCGLELQWIGPINEMPLSTPFCGVELTFTTG